MKLDTSKDRLHVVKELDARAAKIGDSFRNTDRYVVGDLIGLIAIREKLLTLQDMIQTESLWEETIGGVMDVDDETEETREKFVAICSRQAYIFLRIILAQQIERIMNFATNKFASRRLMKFQSDLRDTMDEMREVYAEIYGV